MKNFDEEINSELNNLKKISDNELTHYTKKYLEHFYNFIVKSKSQ